MSVFLLFDRSARLVAAHESAVDFGVVAPLSMFDKSPEEATAVEVRPKVLTRIRPPVFQHLVTHASYLRDPNHGNRVKVDSLEDITRRLQAQAVEQMESKLADTAQRLALLEMGTQRLGFTLPSVDRRHKKLSADLDDEMVELDRWESGHYRTKVPQVLIDWAGKVVPL